MSSKEYDCRSAPVLNIQCNWDDLIRNKNCEIWVSCKFRGENSFNGKIISGGSKDSVSSSEGFSAKWVSDARGISVLHLKSNCRTLFVAPGSQFTGIHKKSIVSLHTTPGGLAVSACTNNQLNVWDTKTGVVCRSFSDHPCDVYQCRFFPSGVVVISGGADMQLKIWSAETGQCPVTLRGHTGSIMDVAIVDRGRNVVSVSKDGTARLWDCGKSACLGILIELPSVINCCAITSVSNKVPLGEPNESPSDREIGTEDKVLIVGCEDGVLASIAVRSRNTLSKKALLSAINCLAPVNEETVAVGCQDGQVFLFNPANLDKPICAWYESNSAALSLLCHSDGIFVGRSDGTCTYLPFKDSNESPKRLLLTGPEYDPIYDISSDGHAIYTACRDGSVRKYSVTKPLQVLNNE
ncbi:proteasomal ATPase-associated factor 1-like [Thrips palmi]|uniref:Proteasomal ATPase-associated factor 1-like n=1 Tax=Thrips palmi TaxID=161013 RepID=A0A6P8ZKN0_THRPL|nr:proteasomal ATPase-associated factor 1-like [Thrips palmi]